MPIPDEKARAWTRPEDYWPPRRPRRSGKPAAERFKPISSERASEARLMLGTVPYAILMLSLAVLAVMIIALAWPGRTTSQVRADQAPTVAVPGTAEKGWIDGR